MAGSSDSDSGGPVAFENIQAFERMDEAVGYIERLRRSTPLIAQSAIAPEGTSREVHIFKVTGDVNADSLYPATIKHRNVKNIADPATYDYFGTETCYVQGLNKETLTNGNYYLGVLADQNSITIPKKPVGIVVAIPIGGATTKFVRVVSRELISSYWNYTVREVAGPDGGDVDDSGDSDFVVVEENNRLLIIGNDPEKGTPGTSNIHVYPLYESYGNKWISLEQHAGADFSEEEGNHYYPGFVSVNDEQYLGRGIKYLGLSIGDISGGYPDFTNNDFGGYASPNFFWMAANPDDGSPIYGWRSTATVEQIDSTGIFRLYFSIGSYVPGAGVAFDVTQNGGDPDIVTITLGHTSPSDPTHQGKIRCHTGDGSIECIGRYAALVATDGVAQIQATGGEAQVYSDTLFHIRAPGISLDNLSGGTGTGQTVGVQVVTAVDLIGMTVTTKTLHYLMGSLVDVTVP